MAKARAEPVPRLYKVAANVYKDYNEGKDSVKNLVYQAKRKHPNIKAIYALVMEALNHSNLLDEATRKVDLFEKEPRFQKELAFVLLTELMFGKKALPGTSLPVTMAQKYHKQIKKSLGDEIDLSEKRKTVDFPKYARVNSLCNSLTRVARHLREDGWLEVMYDKDTVPYTQFVEMVRNLGEHEYLMDYHVPNLIVFPPKTQLYDHPLVEDGSLLIQDKGSCLPVTALGAPAGSCVLDSCSAPGMKTSQIASSVCGSWVAVLGGKPPPGAKVFAIERSTKRCVVLKDILQRSRADKVTTVINQNFLELDPQEFSEVEYIVVDPSCSGDGMVNRNILAQASVTEEKLNSLCFFQKKILSHALSFPSVKKVVYSTCSLTREENEDVLEDVLNKHPSWTLCPAMDNWERRGLGQEYEMCIRADPYQDLCNGFFVAILQPREEGDEKGGERRQGDVKREGDEENAAPEGEGEENPKKKRKKNPDDDVDDTNLVNGDFVTNNEGGNVTETTSEETSSKKKKKKKKKEKNGEVSASDEVNQNSDDISSNNASDETCENMKFKKKKKNKDKVSTIDENDQKCDANSLNDVTSENNVKKKKKKKIRSE